MILESKKVKLRDGIELNGRVKESGSTTWFIASHGIGENLTRHNYIPEILGQDFNIFQYDLRGHGESGGKKVYIEDFQTYIDDLKNIIDILKKEYRIKKYVLFGHSMGALITSSFIQKTCEDDFYPERIFLSSPPVGIGGKVGAITHLIPLCGVEKLASFPLSLALGGLIDLKLLSHDPRVPETYGRDPKNSLTLHSKLLLEMLKASKEVFSRPLRPKCPAFVTIGSEDHVVSPTALISYFSSVEKGFCLKIFEGAFHEIHNEIDKYKLPYLKFFKESLMEVLYDKSRS